ncbi:hypothetical protein ATKI12_8474 [Kitasatospora sp. Ki12]
MSVHGPGDPDGACALRSSSVLNCRFRTAGTAGSAPAELRTTGTAGGGP